MGDIKELSCLVNGQLHCKNKNVNCILKQTHVGVKAKLFIVRILVTLHSIHNTVKQIINS